MYVHSGTSEQGTSWDNINSLMLSFVERLSSSRRFSTYRNCGDSKFFGDLKAVPLVERFFILRPYFRGPLIGGFTVGRSKTLEII